MMSCEPPSSPEAVFEGTQQPVPIGPVVDRGVEVAVFGLG